MVGQRLAAAEAVSVKISLAGFKELDKRLGQLKPTVAKRRLSVIARHALEPFDGSWRRRAPYEFGDLETGGGVGVQLTRSQRQAREREFFSETFAGPGPHPQAIALEFGTAPHIIRGGSLKGLVFSGESGGLLKVAKVNHPGTPAQPFVRPAWEETKGEALEIIKARLWHDIRVDAGPVAGGKAR